MYKLTLAEMRMMQTMFERQSRASSNSEYANLERDLAQVLQDLIELMSQDGAKETSYYGIEGEYLVNG